MPEGHLSINIWTGKIGFSRVNIVSRTDPAERRTFRGTRWTFKGGRWYFRGGRWSFRGVETPDDFD